MADGSFTVNRALMGEMDPYVEIEFGNGLIKQSCVQRNAGKHGKWNQKFMIDL